MDTLTTAAGNTPGRPAPVAGQLKALEALAVIGRTFAHLPAVNFQVGHIYPDTICIDIHGDLGAFEVWREALGIPADAVDHKTLSGQMTLEATTAFSGACIELTGFARPLPVRGEAA